MTWPFEDIVEVHRRWYELTDTGIEIFLINGKTCLLALKSQRVRYFLIKHARLLYVWLLLSISSNMVDIAEYTAGQNDFAERLFRK